MWVYLSMSLFIFAYMCYMCASVLVVLCDKILPTQTLRKQLWMTCGYKTINQPTEKAANKLTNKTIHSAEVWKMKGVTSSAGKPKQKNGQIAKTVSLVPLEWIFSIFLLIFSFIMLMLKLYQPWIASNNINKISKLNV